MSSPGSATVTTPDDYYRTVRVCPFHGLLPPPPLDKLDDGAMLAVASVPGKLIEEWREAYPLWMAWPHAAGAVYAVEMTAAQLRARLAGMDAG